MKPEERAEIVLWDWLKTKSGFIEEVFFNRQNKLNSPVFTTQGLNKKPDFILKINQGYGIKYYAVEVKSSEKSKNILKSSKIVTSYIKNYLENKTKYFINNIEINLTGFLSASDNSPKGYLFFNETFIDNTLESGGKSKVNAATKYKIIPLKEGNRTFEFIRMLWESYSEFRNSFEKKLDIGIIISNEQDNNSPYMMITSYYPKSKRWTQRWWKI